MKKIKPQQCRVIQNKRLGGEADYYSLKFDNFKALRPIWPGNFLHVKVAEAVDPLFRRAFSVADYDPGRGELEIIYKVVGRGTSILSQKKKGDRIDIIGPLGNRFSSLARKKTAVLVAGGIGFPPLYYLAKSLLNQGHDKSKIIFIYGGRSKGDLIEMPRIRRLGVDLVPCTDDGSFGFKGFVTGALSGRIDQLDKQQTFIWGCGPEPMLAALQDMTHGLGLAGEVSLEAPMPCGVGVCLGCIKATLADPRRYVRVCHDGPVFKLGEIKI